MTALQLSELRNQADFHNRVLVLLDVKRNEESLALSEKPSYETPTTEQLAAIALWEAKNKRIEHFAKIYQNGGVKILDKAYADVFSLLQIHEQITAEGVITDADIITNITTIWNR
jgi:hypothetical protein